MRKGTIERRRRALVDFVREPAKPFCDIERKAKFKAMVEEYDMPRIE
jgi:hypothetical protein